jgi:quinolinate synthase
MVATAAPSLIEEIKRLKQERNAVILAHNYQDKAIQEIADYVGDSLGLAYKAKETESGCDRLLRRAFHGGDGQDRESGQDVVLPDANAGCSLEQSCPGPQLEAFLKANAAKNYYVIAYINCSGHVKALSDCICTSGNADKIVEAAPKDRPILFVPDQNLGSWVMERTGRKMDLWKGACYVHVEFTRDSIPRSKTSIPGRQGRRASRMHLRRAHAGR